MTNHHLEYDFKWCPGCGDFGVRRALEMAVAERVQRLEVPVENNVVIAGIGCSGNMVHLLEGPQPYGLHGIHGRTLPVALGVKGARPDLNVVVVAGDGDFLSIGMEHIAPQAARNLDVCALVLDNGVYGLTKGQSSPTTQLGMVTTSTPYGKPEKAINPLELYLTYGVTFIASGFSGKVKDLANLITMGMDHKGFAIVHIQSPCTTYNNTFEALKGNPEKGLDPVLFEVPASHDPKSREEAFKLVQTSRIPVGVVYRDETRPPLDKYVRDMFTKAKPLSLQAMVDSFAY